MWMMPLHLHVNQKSDYDRWQTTFKGQKKYWQVKGKPLMRQSQQKSSAFLVC